MYELNKFIASWLLYATQHTIAGAIHKNFR